MMTEIEIKQNNINELLKLIQENPDLPIVPMVDGDLGGDDFGYYMGKWGKAEIDEVYHEDERIYFRSDDEEELEEKIYFRLESENPAWSDSYSEEKAKEAMAEIEWEKVITVNIGLPY
ncbi:hypothetical protein J2T13_000207 [Paenibacillus sp. DS2015]|uniref:hypothetical protein n=1 Tax=Paenibacillus sp. DS2015 TaxID=3373917 RepID=UPI003D1C3E33